jgi:hypothetical protein
MPIPSSIWGHDRWQSSSIFTVECGQNKINFVDPCPAVLKEIIGRNDVHADALTNRGFDSIR